MIKPITGSLQRKVVLDITVGITLGLGVATYWWHGVHKPRNAVRDAWYAEYAKTKGEE